MQQRRILALLALSAFGWAQAPTSPPTPPNAAHATCGEKPPYTSRTVRTETFIAPDGKHRAYAETEARALYAQRPPNYSGPLCINNARLFVADQDQDFKLIFLQEPSDLETGNSLRPVDWSADSRRLLLELSEWQYETPGVARSMLIYDSRSGAFQQPDLGHTFHKQFERECSLDIHVLGFTSEGKIVFEAEPLSPEEEEILSLSSCSRKNEVYEMDRTTEAIIAAPAAPPKFQHNAKTEPPPK